MRTVDLETADRALEVRRAALVGIGPLCLPRRVLTLYEHHPYVVLPRCLKNGNLVFLARPIGGAADAIRSGSGENAGVGQILQCVPNFSEGRNLEFRRELQLVLEQFPVKVLDLSMDADHNRADCTFLGAPAVVEECAAALCARAVELIDMRTHTGSHPRMGAVDVVPFVPIRGLAMEDAIEVARRFGRGFAEQHGIPVFFYEEACTREARRNLADVRRGEYEGMAAKLQEPEWAVDAGPQAFNERSGATAVGARMPLIAFNVNLGTDDLAIAKAIAAAVRHSSGGLRYVKAMGLEVADRGLVQVSMNLVDYRRTPIHRALELVRSEAARYGVPVRECELVGMAPLEALAEAAGYYLQIPGLDSEKVIEHHLLDEES